VRIKYQQDKKDWEEAQARQKEAREVNKLAEIEELYSLE